MIVLVFERRPSLDQKEFNKLHSSCIDAFGQYVAEAEKTGMLLASCTPEPMPLPERLKIVLQESIEITAHSAYVGAKLLLHEAARLGYAYTP